MIKKELDKHIPCEITNHHILPYIPFAEITRSQLQTHISKIIFYKKLTDLFKFDDSSIRREVFNFNLNDNYEFIFYDENDEQTTFIRVTYEMVSFMKINIIDYFAMWY
jgi:hypothetical protein